MSQTNEPPVPAAPAPPPAAAPPGKDERMWAMFCHLASLAGLVGIPFGNVIGPLVVWLIKKNEMPAVDRQGKESLNFQITLAICIVICIPLMFIFIGILLLPAVGIYGLIMVIIASIKTNKGEDYRYPISIRFIK